MTKTYNAVYGVNLEVETLSAFANQSPATVTSCSSSLTLTRHQAAQYLPTIPLGHLIDLIV